MNDWNIKFTTFQKNRLRVDGVIGENDHFGQSLTVGQTIYSPYSAGIDISRQNLTSKVDPRPVSVQIFYNGHRPIT